jgi:PadR family transcriptional regulator, regulatory protein PadR
MAALIRRKPDIQNNRDEIPPGTLYLLILKTLAVRGRLHGYEIAQFQRVMGAISRIIQTA